MENDEKRVDHGINNSTFINITGKGGGGAVAKKPGKIFEKKFGVFFLKIFHEYLY